jgi:hypothetical protein
LTTILSPSWSREAGVRVERSASIDVVVPCAGPLVISKVTVLQSIASS